MKIKDETDYHLAKMFLKDLYHKRNNSPEESEHYYNLLTEITSYEEKKKGEKES